MGDNNVHNSGLNTNDWLALRDVLWAFYRATHPAQVEIPQGLPEHLREHPVIGLVRNYQESSDDKYLDQAGQLLVPTDLPFGWRDRIAEREPVSYREVEPRPYAGHPAKFVGPAIRRWIEMVGILHRLGYGRLRLACYYENAGPAPAWFGIVAAGFYFRGDHGAILARHPFPEKEKAARENFLPNDVPMISSRRCLKQPSYPWPGYQQGTAENAAIRWVESYPELAAEGVGQDVPYVAWYSRMLEATSPHGLIAAYTCANPPTNFMYVSWGSEGTDQFELPPPGLAKEAELD